MTAFDPTQPQATEIVVDEVNHTIAIDDVIFGYAVDSNGMQIGHVAGSDPFVRLPVIATTVRRITSSGVDVFEEPNGLVFDPDADPDEE